MTEIVYNKNGIPFDIDALATDVNGKADRDLLNVSDTGNIQMAKASMPSNTYIDLTVGASGTTYTAPADGWFAGSRQTSNPAQVTLVNDATGLGIVTTPERSAGMRVFIPAKKGDVVRLAWWQGDSWSYFRFIYAQGSESEAN